MSTLTIHSDLEQRSPEWYAIRCGMITASLMGKLVTTAAPGAEMFDCPECASPAGEPCVSLRGGKPIKTMHPDRHALSAAAEPVLTVADSDTSRGIIATLAAERISGKVEESHPTPDMWRGIESEPFAREAYSAHRAKVVETGFMVRDFGRFKIGCSPDGLVGDDGGIEIKSPRAKSHVLTVIDGEVPAQHMAQMQTFLLVSGRTWCDFISFHGGLHLFVQRVTRDPHWESIILDAAAAAEASIAALVAAYEQAVDGMPLTDPLPDYYNDEITV